MNFPDQDHKAPAAAFDVRAPRRQTLPLVLASPHSGQWYPPGFVAGSRLSAHELRRSEDSFVDEIFAAAPALGAPLLRALYARAYVDPNREPYELDPMMFDGDLPSYANARSPRVAAGLGAIPRMVANGEEIYDRRISLRDGLARIAACHQPYHERLAGLIEDTRARFGHCLVVDCHSMPSLGAAAPGATGQDRMEADFVLGDLHGAACAPVVTETAERALRKLGYSVARNVPYAGGYTTRRYGRPESRAHALQIEINRRLYMDEDAIAPLAYMRTLARHMDALVGALGAISGAALDATAA